MKRPTRAQRDSLLRARVLYLSRAGELNDGILEAQRATLGSLAARLQQTESDVADLAAWTLKEIRVRDMEIGRLRAGLAAALDQIEQARELAEDVQLTAEATRRGLALLPERLTEQLGRVWAALRLLQGRQ